MYHSEGRYNSGASVSSISKHAGTILEKHGQTDYQSIKLDESKTALIRLAFDEITTDSKGMIAQERTKQLMEKLGLRLDVALFSALVLKSWPEVESISFEEFLHLYLTSCASSWKFGEKLRLAAQRGDEDIVRELLLRGCAVNSADGNGMTSLHHAASSGQLNVAKLMLDTSKNQLELDCMDTSGWTPLMTASSYGQVCFVRWLLEQGAKAEVINNFGRTALHIAALAGQESVVRVLISSLVNINAVDNMGCTPLHLAVMHGYFGTAKTLVKCKSDISIRDCIGHTPQYYANGQKWKDLMIS